MLTSDRHSNNDHRIPLVDNGKTAGRSEAHCSARCSISSVEFGQKLLLLLLSSAQLLLAILPSICAVFI